MKSLYETILTSTGAGMFVFKRERITKLSKNTLGDVMDMKRMKKELNMRGFRDPDVLLAYLEKHPLDITRAKMYEIFRNVDFDREARSEADKIFKSAFKDYIKDESLIHFFFYGFEQRDHELSLVVKYNKSPYTEKTIFDFNTL